MYLHLKTSPERAKGHAASPAQGRETRLAFCTPPPRLMLYVEAKARRDGEGSTPETNTPHPATGSLLCGGDGDRVYILVLWMVFIGKNNVYCFFLLWNEVAFLSSFSQYLPLSLLLFFSSRNTTLCETAVQWLSAGKQPGMWNEAFVKLTLNFFGKNEICCSSHFSLLEVLRASPLFSSSNVVWG